MDEIIIKNWKPDKEIKKFLGCYHNTFFTVAMKNDGSMDLAEDGKPNFCECDDQFDAKRRWANLCEQPADNYGWRTVPAMGYFLGVRDGIMYRCAILKDGSKELGVDGQPLTFEITSEYEEEMILRWNALCEDKPQPETQLANLLKELNDKADEISDLYKKFPTLNDSLNIRGIIPQSFNANLDQWIYDHSEGMASK